MKAAGAALTVEAVSKVRALAEGGEKEVLRAVSLEVPAGTLTVIVGPSGGGKSSLLRLLNRLDDPTAGRVFLDGKDIASLDPLALRRRVGMVPQKPCMFEGSVLANLQLAFVLTGEDPPTGDSDEIVRVLDLCRLSAELLPRQARSLSLGQQQRVSLARTLLTRPRVLLLDEPTSALDRPTAVGLAATLRDACRSLGLTVLMVTHDLPLAEGVADRLAYLAEGEILEEGPAAEMLESPRSEKFRQFLSTPGEET